MIFFFTRHFVWFCRRVDAIVTQELGISRSSYAPLFFRAFFSSFCTPGGGRPDGSLYIDGASVPNMHFFLRRFLNKISRVKGAAAMSLIFVSLLCVQCPSDAPMWCHFAILILNPRAGLAVIVHSSDSCTYT